MGMMTEAMPVGLPEGGMSRFEARWMSWPNFQSTRGPVSFRRATALIHTFDRGGKTKQPWCMGQIIM